MLIHRKAEQAGAVDDLREAVEICPRDFIEYDGARVELKRLGS